MDDLIELIIELVLDGCMELLPNKKVPMWIRVLISCVFMIIIFGIFILGIALFNDSIIAGIIMILISILFMITIIYKIKKHNKGLQKDNIKLFTFMIIIFIGIFIYLYFENNTLEITNYDIVNEKITEDFNNFKIAQISDYHNVKSNKLNKKLINDLKKSKPDIIVITGDFIDSHRTNIDISIDFIKNIKDIAPIYYVTGNHEGNINNYNVLKEKLIDYDVIILNDEVQKIIKDDSFINIVGINDPFFVKEKVDEEVIVKNKLNNIEYDEKNYTILLSHRPELIEIYSEFEFDLVFSGHAHGGQIRLPFIGGVIAPHQGFFPKYDSGLYEIKNTTFIVSRGIGNSTFPFRINNNPELIIVNLKGDTK